MSKCANSDRLRRLQVGRPLQPLITMPGKLGSRTRLCMNLHMSGSWTVFIAEISSPKCWAIFERCLGSELRLILQFIYGCPPPSERYIFFLERLFANPCR